MTMTAKPILEANLMEQMTARCASAVPQPPSQVVINLASGAVLQLILPTPTRAE